MSCNFPKIIIAIAIIFNNFIILHNQSTTFFNTLHDKLNSQEKKKRKTLIN